MQPNDPTVMLPENLFTKPLFVYGTLRVGEGNYRWIDPCVIEYEEHARTCGHLWFYRSRNSYPVAKFWTDSEIRSHIAGDLLWCDTESNTFMDMVRMEIRAGYEVCDIKAKRQNGEVVDAVGFHYIHAPNPDLYIPSGDWRASVREEVS